MHIKENLSAYSMAVIFLKHKICARLKTKAFAYIVSSFNRI